MNLCILYKQRKFRKIFFEFFTPFINVLYMYCARVIIDFRGENESY